MPSLKQAITNFESALSSFADYLEVWANFDVTPEYQTRYSKEFVAFMLLKTRGELERHARALRTYAGERVQALVDVRNELERLFMEEVVAVSGKEITEILANTLDCVTLIPDLNEYVGLWERYASGSRRGMQTTEYPLEIGCDLILKRDELQLVIDGVNALIGAKGVSADTSHAWEEQRAQLSKIDTAIRQHAQAFKPLHRFMRNLREDLGDKVLDQERYWWWFLDEQEFAESPVAEAILSPQQVKRAAQQLADLADGIGGDENAIQRGRRLLLIGQLAYRQLVSSSHPSHWEPLAKFAHGALNQAVILLAERADLSQYAEACYSLSLVCRYIARWTGTVNIAERSLRLLKVASDHPATKDLASLGLGSLSLQDIEVLIDDLKERERKASHELELVSARAAIPVLDPVEVLTWLSSAYGVKPRDKKGIWIRIDATIRQLTAPMTEAFMRPRLAEIMGTIGAGESVRDEKRGEVLGELRPGMKGRLYWPRDVRPCVYLVLSIEDRPKLGLVAAKPVQIVLWANVPPPKGLEWADWVIRGQWKADIGAHQRSVEIPISQPQRSVDEEQKSIIRNWICQYLVIEPPSQEVPD
jgi:hypothetical protein